MDLDDGPLYGIIIYTGNSWQVDGDGRWTMTDRLSQGRIETTDHKKYKNVDGGRREDRWTKVRLSRSALHCGSGKRSDQMKYHFLLK